MRSLLVVVTRRAFINSLAVVAVGTSAGAHALLNPSPPDSGQEYGVKLSFEGGYNHPLLKNHGAGGPGFTIAALTPTQISGCVFGTLEVPCQDTSQGLPASLTVTGNASLVTGRAHIFMQTHFIQPTFNLVAQDAIKVMFVSQPGSPGISIHHVTLTWGLHGQVTHHAGDQFQITNTVMVGDQAGNVFGDTGGGVHGTISTANDVQYFDGSGNPWPNGQSFLSIPGRIDDVRTAVVTFKGDEATIPWNDHLNIVPPNNGTVDFGHTAELSVQADAGAIITSASGVFLTEVPEPAAIAAIAIGLFGVGAMGARRGASPAELNPRTGTNLPS